ncbi:glycosyltransferase family 4 protein [Paraferrimonas sedimenticola]|uniref:Glycoside hydrolase n=1 Tax=Paraferrimonas sedimenticola TaxID=375674 RepID=A0AA37RVR7_9GAMM|nr:glycosyltransferase family 4 protein [Paraferrimonas sedimenticola]GLP95572.1 glycoside hydrolase [Paraferrimonas sedimenticola]
MTRPIKVALLVDEYFGGAKTAFGGYGFLARHIVAKHLPNDEFEVEVLLKKTGAKLRYAPKCYMVDGIPVYHLASTPWDWNNRRFLRKKNYDVYLSIELTNRSFEIMAIEPDTSKPLLLWVQDPRPKADWEEIDTVELFAEDSYYHQPTYDFVHQAHQNGRVQFVTQAHFLTPKAKELYRLPADTPIPFLPNPIEIDRDFDVEQYPKKNQVIFLGRIESVKRGWLFCEIAKAMPELEFIVLGKSGRDQEANQKIMAPYYEIENLTFAGHVEGERKQQFLRDAKVLVNTSIHEALPVSFLEALEVGTLLVSCQNPDNLTERFGHYTGVVLGDGFDKVPLFVEGIRKLIDKEAERQVLAIEARQYILDTHSIEAFQRDMRAALKGIVKR